MLNLLSPALFVNHRGATDTDAPSNRIWSKVQGMAVSPDGTRKCDGLVEAFKNFGTIAPAISGTTAGQFNGYGYYVDTATTACSIAQSADGNGVKFTTGATDNHQADLISGGDVGGIGNLTLAGGKLVAFETRVKFTPGGTDSLTFALGLAEPGTSGNDAISDAGAIGAFDFMGFYTSNVSDGLDIINFGYRTAAGSMTAVSGVAQSITSGTWYKLGFVFDPSKADECLTVYVDGVLVATVSKATLTAATNFPDTTNFAAYMAVKSITAAANVMQLDWINCVQVG